MYLKPSFPQILNIAENNSENSEPPISPSDRGSITENFSGPSSLNDDRISLAKKHRDVDLHNHRRFEAGNAGKREAILPAGRYGNDAEILHRILAITDYEPQKIVSGKIKRKTTEPIFQGDTKQIFPPQKIHNSINFQRTRKMTNLQRRTKKSREIGQIPI